MQGLIINSKLRQYFRNRIIFLCRRARAGLSKKWDLYYIFMRLRRIKNLYNLPAIRQAGLRSSASKKEIPAIKIKIFAQLTLFGGDSPLKNAIILSATIVAILSLTSLAALPICGRRTTLSNLMRSGCTFGSNS